MFSASNLTLAQLSFSEDRRAPSNVTIRGNGLVLSGDKVDVPGALVAFGKDGVTISGNLTVDGSVTVSSNSTLNVTGSLVMSTAPNALVADNKASVTISGTVTVAGSVSLGEATLTVTGALVIPSNNLQLTKLSLVFLSGLLHSSVNVVSGAELGTVGPDAMVVGTVNNYGLVNVSTSNTLTIYDGDYNQLNNASLQVSLGTQGHAALVVANGTIVLANTTTIQYSIKDKPFLKSATFLVASANVSVTGTFASDASPLPGSAISRPLTVQYSPKEIQIRYHFSAADVDPWMWVVLGVAVAVILIATITIIVKCRRRSQYEMVR